MKKFNNKIKHDKTRQKRMFKILFILTGILSTIWILIRIIPKPQRATYPCVKATAPWASAFIIYLIGITGSVFSLRRFGTALKKAKYPLSFALLLLGVVFAAISISSTPTESKALELSSPLLSPNTPIGVAKGIHPGRVVWIYDSAATNHNMTNTVTDYWFQNTDQDVIDGMLNAAIKNIAGETDIYKAWNSIFVHFNKNHSRGQIGYSEGEKIFVKINLTTSCCGGWKNGTEKAGWLDHMDATPQLCYTLLHQLVNVVGVAESDIYFGDPFRRFHDVYWDMLHTDFPDVHYMDGDGLNGREQTTLTQNEILKFSDGKKASRLPQEYVDATYFINMPCLKTHNEGGITLTAKNHQGSIIEYDASPTGQSAQFMHYALPANNTGHNEYRHLVDYMGHEHLGGKTLIYIVDGIWAGFNWEGIVEKWNMTPFSGDYPSSIFVSLDPVALESVCYDFLLEEYKDKPTEDKFPYIDGTDDFLLQAADESNWPSGITYDPENDGSKLTSLGVHEHWNNATDKQYSRNLGTGNGIELLKAESDYNFDFTGINNNPTFDQSINVYPQPARNYISVDFFYKSEQVKEFRIIDINGKVIIKNTIRNNSGSYNIDVSGLEPGNFILQISLMNGKNYTEKIIIQ